MARGWDPSTYKYDPSPVWPEVNGTASGNTDGYQRIVMQEGNSTTNTASFVEDVPAEYVDRCLVSEARYFPCHSD
jgi:hypothetical protein